MKVLAKLYSNNIVDECKYSGTSPYGNLTSKKTSQLQSPWLSPKLYSTVQTTPCNKVTSPLRSLLPSPVGDLNREFQSMEICFKKSYTKEMNCPSISMLRNIYKLIMKVPTFTRHEAVHGAAERTSWIQKGGQQQNRSTS